MTVKLQPESQVHSYLTADVQDNAILFYLGSLRQPARDGELDAMLIEIAEYRRQ